ncbi:MAG: hypothetical protein OM95_14615 [Bdellovibrio sp. ArHS]|uniref:DUF1697 domain-containing protein n=1 Tax=Bdellovibrio sp. ArHS TaxID=1569284 RepID=UPI0005839190|nr:DUF1697 domain-containing protein [Bdellovibrio sp. ArHS]KHD87414.1 MAG: hypothetical protein OM95_14615 [Bdellovibrio sp. ArHS]
MNYFIVFLRAVTPTGTNRVPMAELRVLLQKNGFFEVRTYIQSGNVLLRTSLGAREVEKKVRSLIKKNFGGDLDTFALTPQELDRILFESPFKKFDGKRHYYTLLSEAPGAAARKAFAEIDFHPDKFELKGTVIYAEYKTLISESKYNNNFFEKRLSLRATTRNHNTMFKLLEIARQKDV